MAFAVLTASLTSSLVADVTKILCWCSKTKVELTIKNSLIHCKAFKFLPNSYLGYNIQIICLVDVQIRRDTFFDFSVLNNEIRKPGNSQYVVYIFHVF